MMELISRLFGTYPLKAIDAVDKEVEGMKERLTFLEQELDEMEIVLLELCDALDEAELENRWLVEGLKKSMAIQKEYLEGFSTLQ